MTDNVIATVGRRTMRVNCHVDLDDLDSIANIDDIDPGIVATNPAPTMTAAELAVSPDIESQRDQWNYLTRTINGSMHNDIKTNHTAQCNRPRP